MKNKYSLLVLVILLSICTLKSQTAPKLLFSGENYSWQTLFYQSNNIQPCYLLYQAQFVVDKSLNFDKKLMEKSMDKFIPDKNTTGYGVLDWEGNIFNIIAGYTTVTQKVFDEHINEFIATLRYAKFLRPNIKWSFYAMPTYVYFKYAEGKSKTFDKRLLLLRELDFLAPSFYVFYDGKTVPDAFSTQLIDANLSFALELASKLNKPVYAFVWHRYCPGTNIINGNKIIDVVTFKAHISRILNTTNFNRKPTGIIWWNCEDFLAGTRTRDSVIMAEYKNVTDVELYKKNILKTYLDVINSVVK